MERPMLAPPPAEWLIEAARLTADYPGALLEPKERGFSMHYRAVPEAGPVLRDGLFAMLAESGEFELLAGNMIWEVRPRGVDKGTAVEAVKQKLSTRPDQPVDAVKKLPAKEIEGQGLAPGEIKQHV